MTTNSYLDSQLSVLKPSAEAMGSPSEISSATSSEAAPFIDPSISTNKGLIPLATSEEDGPPPRLHELPVEETVSEMIPSVAHSPTYTQSPETAADTNPVSATNLQSDSSESYVQVSAGDMFGAEAEMFTATQETCFLLQNKKKICIKHS